MKLYDIPKKSKIYNLWPNGDKEAVVIFDHLDGAYSYCYLEKEPTTTLHLAASIPLAPFKDGYELGAQPRGTFK